VPTVQSDDPLSIAVLGNAPAPYRTPFFNELARHCRLLVSFDTNREPHREWVLDEREFEFDRVLTRGVSIPRMIRPGPSRIHIPLNIVPMLKRFQPDVVVSSELGVRTASAALYCQLSKRPLIVWWEGTPQTDGANRLTAARRRLLLRRADRVWGNGRESGRSLKAHGVRASQIDLGVIGMDTLRWRKDVDEARRGTTRSVVRNRHGLRGTVILFVGQLTALKGVPELLAALSILAMDRDLPPWSALFVGSGPLAQEIEVWAQLHPAVAVAIAGFIQPHELAKYYAAADLFAMPSLFDPWGLVCLDALVAGIPQVTSLFSGAAADLVTSNAIGAIVEPKDIRSLADHLADHIRMGPERVPESIRDSAMKEWSVVSMAERAMSSIILSLATRKS
jgi:glycosyltransferase involved in cell wall biosynthesis